MAKILHQTLQRLETRLQALIEGSTARLFPSYSFRKDLAKRLVGAMQVEIHPDAQGVLTAPNLYTIFLPEEQAQIFHNQQELLDELADCLHRACQDTQVYFVSDPVVKVIPISESSATELQIIAQFSLPPDESTSVLESSPVANASDLTPQAFLIVDGTRIFPLDGKLVCIEQSQENELIIDHPQISPLHAQLRWINGQYTIFDLNSANGTFVNGEKVSQFPLSPGDVISLGGLPLVFGMDQNADLDRTQEMPFV